MTSGLGADAHSDGSADSVELPPGMLSECPDYPRAIDADLSLPARWLRALICVVDLQRCPVGTMVNHRITSELSGVSASSPSLQRREGHHCGGRTTNFVMTKSGAGVGGLLLCE